MREFIKKRLAPQLIKVYRIFPKRDKFKLLGILGLMLLAAGFEVAGIGIIPTFIATISDPEGIKEYPVIGNIIGYLGIDTQKEMLTYGAIAMIAVFLLKNSYMLFFFYFRTKFVFNRKYEFGRRLMQSYMQAPYTYHLTSNTSALLRNVTQEVNMMISKFMMPFLKFTMQGFLALAILLFLFIIEPFITAIVFLFLGIIAAVFLNFTSQKTKGYGLKAQKHREGMIKTISQGLGGLKDARVLNREFYFIRKFNVEARGNADSEQFNAFIKQIPRPIIETLAVAGMLLISLIMVWQGRSVASIIPVLSLFGMAIIRLMPAIQQVMSLFTQIRYNIVSVDPVHDDLQALRKFRKGFSQNKYEEAPLALKSVIKAHDLVYYYPNSNERALNKVNFEIPRGFAVAFTGPSGAGKTTVADILLGLLEPHEGSILIDGKPLFENLSAWQKNIGYIPQFIYLSDDTIRENIAFGLPPEEIDEDHIKHAVRMAQLEELINKLPEGLDTVVGERGVRLSGGQRQRVGIARALYHDPQVLIMDEATSALDNLTEKYIVQAIERLKRERTVIMIAHRLTTVQNCDTIYFMQEGQITSSGSYEELLEKNEEFRKLAVG